jgi:uncharacterized protein (DUF58 family)
VALAAVTVALLLAALGGNNVVYAVAAVGLSLWGAEALVGRWNLAGLEVRREMPDEVFAGRDAHGWLWVRNERRFGSSGGLTLHDGDARAEVALAAPGIERRAGITWRFGARGRHRLPPVDVGSTWPFGWIERRVAVPCPGEVVVYPTPLGGGRAARVGAIAGPGDAAGGGAGTGDLNGIRPWRAGDPLRAIHAVTSARLGEWMIVARESEQVPAYWIHLDLTVPLEEAIGRATGEVLALSREGVAVGLRLGADALPPRAGTAWRRTLLEALARVGEPP